MKYKYLFSSLLIFAVYSLLSWFVHQDIFRSLDYQLMINIQKVFQYKTDFLFSLFTLMGSTETTFIIIMTVFAYLRFRKKIYFLGIFLYILIYPLELLGKLLIYHPIPPLILNRYVFNFHLPSSYVVQTSYSYPSGHMARAAFLIGLFLIILWRKKNLGIKKFYLSLPLIGYFLLMFVSRIYLGEHWFSDVLGGSILGLAIAFFSFAFF